MLEIKIPSMEFFDEETEEFGETKDATFQIEHSLISLSKWESKWCKPFLGKDSKTIEETLDYIRCMTITQNVNPEIYRFISNETFTKITEYIDAKMTATWFNESPGQPRSKEIITAEIIYYWMISLNIPMECQKWHLNRLLTLIKVCNIKNQPPRKRSKKEMLTQRAALNQARRNQINSKG